MDNSGSDFVWYELTTTDTEAAKAFYASVVGWGIGEVPMPGSAYTLFTVKGYPVAGMARLMPGAEKSGVLPQWMGYVRVGDVDATAAAVRPLGGTIHVPPTEIPNVSRFSIIADPEMAALALIRGREGGEDSSKVLGPGRVVWHELVAANPEKSFAFYNKLFGWQKAGAHSRDWGAYQEFTAGAEPIGGIFTRPPMLQYSFWIHYINVPNIETAVQRVVAGGGKVLYGPLVIQGRSVIAHCTDPQGAIFGLLESTFRFSIGCYAPRDPAEGRTK